MAGQFARSIQTRWTDIDANRHLRHSAYYDYGATLRMMFFSENGLSTQKLEELQIGPILFREEAIFKREIRLEDEITVDVALIRATPDYSRFSFRHCLIKGDGSIAAVITVDAAWIDLIKRKLTVPPPFIQSILEKCPTTEDFQFASVAKKV